MNNINKLIIPDYINNQNIILCICIFNISKYFASVSHAESHKTNVSDSAVSAFQAIFETCNIGFCPAAACKSRFVTL